MQGEPKKKSDEGLSSSAQSMRSAQRYLDAVWKFVGGVLVGVLGGWFFDKHFHTSPWGLVTLLFLGTTAGFIGLIRDTTRMGQRR